MAAEQGTELDSSEGARSSRPGTGREVHHSPSGLEDDGLDVHVAHGDRAQRGLKSLHVQAPLLPRLHHLAIATVGRGPTILVEEISHRDEARRGGIPSADDLQQVARGLLGAKRGAEVTREDPADSALPPAGRWPVPSRQETPRAS